MKQENFSNLSLEELQSRVAEEKARLNKLSFSHAVTRLENPNQLRVARKNIARMLTHITQKSA